MRWEIAAPITIYITYRAYTHASLTLLGCLTAALTATIHALHPSPLPFTLLLVFFVCGTAATKVKKDVKATVTLSTTGSHSRSSSGSSALGVVFSSGWNKTNEAHEKREAARLKAAAQSTAGGQEPRSSVQVIANSGCVTVLCLLHVYLYGLGEDEQLPNSCFGSMPARDLILVGIIANYAAVMADTLSSELGILSSHKPRFILTLREVPAGTNGGITGMGLASGLAGAILIGGVSVLMLPKLCDGTIEDVFGLVLFVGAWGALGSVLDSILGALFQASVVDRRTGKVIEAPNGGRVLYLSKKEKDESEESKPSRMLGSGRDLLDNNQVNILMAAIMTVSAVLGASQAWGVPLSALWNNTI